MAQQILVADDEEHILFQVVQVLRQRGYNVETARDGADALARALARPPDLLISDGKVLRAEMQGGGASDADCIYQALRWKTGEFEFAARAVDVADRIGTSTTHLLMEGARRADEDSAPVRMPGQLDDDAAAEWEADERTPMLVAAQLAELVRRTARATLQPLPAAAAEPAAAVARPAAVVAEPAKAAEP